MKESILELIKYKELDLSDYVGCHDLYEALEYDGSLHELIDGSVDIYTRNLWQWAADNYEYVDQALDEGLADASNGILSCLSAGQYIQLQEQANEALEEIFTEYQESLTIEE